MKSHDVAKQLLDLPDVELRVVGQNGSVVRNVVTVNFVCGTKTSYSKSPDQVELDVDGEVL